jgi:sec-independent protein translocase protein TatB
MFGMGFMEIMIIAVVAVIFLGPDKLPETMVNIAKFFRSMKSTVANAKESLEQEMNISELKKEALSYKEDLLSASDELSRVTSMADLDDDYDFIHDTAPKDKSAKTDDGISKAVASKPASEETVTFEKKKKKKKEKLDEENKEEDNA